MARAAWSINGIGAVLSLIVDVIIAITKFTHGAWVIVVLVPIMVVFLVRLARQYETGSRAARARRPRGRRRPDPAPPRRAGLHRPPRPGRRPGHPVRPHPHARRAAGRPLRRSTSNAPTSSPRRGPSYGMSRIALDLVDCPDRRLTRAAVELVARDLADGRDRSQRPAPRPQVPGLLAPHPPRPDRRGDRARRVPAPPRQRHHRPVPLRNPRQETEPLPVQAGGAYGRQAERHPSHSTRWSGATGQHHRQRGRRSDPDRRRPVAPAGHHRGTRPHGAGPTGGGQSRVRVRRRGWHRRDVRSSSPAAATSPASRWVPACEPRAWRANTRGDSPSTTRSTPCSPESTDGRRAPMVNGKRRAAHLGVGSHSTPGDRPRCQLRPPHHRSPWRGPASTRRHCSRRPRRQRRRRSRHAGIALVRARPPEPRHHRPRSRPPPSSRPSPTGWSGQPQLTSVPSR